MTPVLRYFQNSYRKKNKHRYSVWTGIPPSSTHSTYKEGFLLRNVHDVFVRDCHTPAFILEWPDGETRPSLFGCRSSQSREVSDVFLVSLITPFTQTLLSSPVLIWTAPPLGNIITTPSRQCFISRVKEKYRRTQGFTQTPMEITFLSVWCVCLELHQEVSSYCSSICYVGLFAHFPTLETHYMTYFSLIDVVLFFSHTMGRFCDPSF